MIHETTGNESGGLIRDPWATAESQVGERLERYLDLLLRWGQVYNLTAIRDRSAMRTQHLYDSWALLPFVDRWRPRAGFEPVPVSAPESPSEPGTEPQGEPPTEPSLDAQPPSRLTPWQGPPRSGAVRPTLLDVGSGAGLPGVVVAIARPDWQVVCVDKVGKKAGFVRQVALELGLSNLLGLHARVEQLPSLPDWRRHAPLGADIITSRAYASLVDFVRGTTACRARDGVWLAMKGQRPEAELAALAAWCAAPGPGPALGLSLAASVDDISVPGLGSAQRCIVTIQPPGGDQVARA